MQRLVWKHFALVAVVFLLFQAGMWAHGLSTWPHRPTPTSWTGIWQYLEFNWPSYFVGALPAISAIALALLDLRPGAIRVAATVVGVALAVMIVFDVWAVPVLGRAAIGATYGAPAWPIRADSLPLRLDDTSGVLQRSLALIRGKVGPADIQPWPPKTSSNSGLTAVTDPAIIVRLEATRTAAALLPFFLLLIDVGLVLGITSWVSHRARFERQRDARILRVVGAWVVVLFVETFVRVWMQAQSFDVSARHEALLWLYVPAMPAAVLAALGWRAAARTIRAAGA